MSWNPKNDAKIPIINTPLGKIPFKDNGSKTTNNLLPTNEKFQYLNTIYRRLSWLKENVDGIYILPINLPSKYFDYNNSIFIDNQQFYAVTKHYYFMRINGKIQTVDDDNMVTLDLNSEIFTFKIGFSVKNGKTAIQTKDMFLIENKYIKTSNKSEINFKSTPVNDDEKEAARIYLNEYVPDKNYLNELIQIIAYEKKSSYNFMMDISKILTAAKFGNTFQHKLKEKFYSSHVINKLDFNEYFSGTDRNFENSDDIVEYIEDQAMQILYEVSNYYKNFSTRKITKPTLKTPKQLHINKIDIRSQCENICNVKDIPEDHLTFYSHEGKFYCFDIFKLYVEFSNGNFVDDATGISFPKDFVNKINNLYKLKIKTNPLIEHEKAINENNYNCYANKKDFYSSKKYTPVFYEILNKVRSDIEKLNISSDKCSKCEKSLGLSRYSSVNSKGNVINLCSKECFDKI